MYIYLWIYIHGYSIRAQGARKGYPRISVGSQGALKVHSRGTQSVLMFKVLATHSYSSCTWGYLGVPGGQEPLFAWRHCDMNSRTCTLPALDHYVMPFAALPLTSLLLTAGSFLSSQLPSLRRALRRALVNPHAPRYPPLRMLRPALPVGSSGIFEMLKTFTGLAKVL